jgi:cholestenol Delta-isomerase
MTVASHPFYPLGLDLVGYVEKDLSVTAIFTGFTATVLSLLAATRAYTHSINPKLSGRDQALAVWFVLTGCIHLIIEGYFSLNHMHMPSRTDWLASAWKEYANCDSRYLTADPFVVCMETITAWAWGPLSLLTTYLIANGSPWRHPVQIVVSGGQFYGDVLYFMTNWMDEWYSGISYSRPEALYYWGYFVGMNLIWLVIPGCKLFDRPSGGIIANMAQIVSHPVCRRLLQHSRKRRD